ncbi:MAG: glycosyltransferase [Anaerolineales bacterium]|uniref:glycosyltransferase n=1 Tax=Candidatus Villigracilis proximus TaxID=3140683 RepID=UPI0031346CDA|nr:glycosyltransferase [Anaerolineales bacterium]
MIRFIFTGKVADEAVNAYYRAAHIFLSASEHEGFGMPLIEAMALDIPVIALASSAVPETMGQGGLLVYDWNSAQVAELMQLMLNDTQLKERTLAAQRLNLNRFSVREAAIRMKAAVRYLQNGKKEAMLQLMTPVLY